MGKGNNEQGRFFVKVKGTKEDVIGYFRYICERENIDFEEIEISEMAIDE
jgi:hypothetical protein